MENNNAIKADLLGMPFGTANGKLRKKLLFHLAGKLAMLECFRCHESIESIEDFSIEHTESWQYAKDPIETFFDVEKIAFSHIDCNVRASQRVTKPCGHIGSYMRGCRCESCRRVNAERAMKTYTPEKRHDKYLRTGN